VLAALNSMWLMGWILNLEADTHGLTVLDWCVVGPMNGKLSTIFVRMYPHVGRDLALLRQLDHVHGRCVATLLT
jgi:hypothetical protein